MPAPSTPWERSCAYAGSRGRHAFPAPTAERNDDVGPRTEAEILQERRRQQMMELDLYRRRCREEASLDFEACRRDDMHVMAPHPLIQQLEASRRDDPSKRDIEMTLPLPSHAHPPVQFESTFVGSRLGSGAATRIEGPHQRFVDVPCLARNQGTHSQRFAATSRRDRRGEADICGSICDDTDEVDTRKSAARDELITRDSTTVVVAEGGGRRAMPVAAHSKYGSCSSVSSRRKSTCDVTDCDEPERFEREASYHEFRY
eukprot:gnl/TRDRNA2_/TRDRNA2_173886_c0_seq1.p1 gnl/TRDRNA2_/TRDRNA2_173886_c0~~gnl/TRDRNA2_/TRDRNA2_173886_c0_seq1.p1  ORF type:complete len:259 (-),score=21.53 gnl/TRDRNA2_/TRDRNA2_173886_c0_seq1:91-867(-)